VKTITRLKALSIWILCKTLLMAAAAGAAPDVGLRVVGIVFGSSGSPVAGARAELRLLQPNEVETPEALASATADAHGRFWLEAPAVGVYAVTVTAPGHVPMRYLALPMVEERRIVPVVLPLAFNAEFLVRDSFGTPRPGARIDAESSRLAKPIDFGGWHPAPRSAATGADGRAVLPRLRGELLDVTLRVPELAFETLRQGVGQASFTLPRSLPQTLAASSPRVMGPPPSARLEGRVLDSEGGAPLSGALVWSAADPGRFTLSDEGGVFELLGVAGQPLEAVAPGFLVGESEQHEERMTLRLNKARAGFGRVLDLEKRPLAGVEVSIRSAGDLHAARSPFVHTRTDAEGRYEIAALPSSAIDLRASRRGFVATTVRGIEAGTSAKCDLGTVLLAPSVSLPGRVVDAAGRPVPDVSVWTFDDVQSPVDLLLAGTPDEPPAATSDASGHFEITGLPSGRRQHLLLRAEGFLPRGVGAVEAPKQGAKLADIVLRRGASLRGRVFDEEGQPVAGAAVAAAPVFSLAEKSLPGNESYASVRSDETGAFSFPDLVPGRFSLTAEAPDFLPSGPRELSVAPGLDSPELVFTLARGAVLSGRVRNARGESVAGARIYVASGVGRTDAEGVYRFGGIAPGVWDARVVHPAYCTVVLPVKVDEVGESVLDVELPTGHPASGRVIDDEGLPAFGAHLMFELEVPEDSHPEDRHWQRATSNENGFFELAEVPDGTYRVYGERKGFARLQQASALRVDGRAVRDLEVVMERGASVLGEIRGLDFDTLATVRLWAEPEDGPRLAGQVRHDGHFQIDDLGSGPWLLVAELPGEARQARASLVLAPGERRARRDLIFEGSKLEGKVLLDGEALADARIDLESRDATLRRSTTSDHQGQFHLADLPAGRYRLHIGLARRLVSHSQELLLGDGAEILRIDIESVSLRGTVRSADQGEPRSGARVSLWLLAPAVGALTGSDPMSLFAVASEADGSYYVPRLTSGRYRFTVESDGFTLHDEEIVLLPGDTEHSVDLEKEPASAGSIGDGSLAPSAQAPF